MKLLLRQAKSKRHFGSARDNERTSEDDKIEDTGQMVRKDCCLTTVFDEPCAQQKSPYEVRGGSLRIIRMYQAPASYNANLNPD
jgi:hypothetical protein